MDGTGNHWRKVCAPRLKRIKDLLGRQVPEREIAAAVHVASGKRTTRQLVSLWLHGEREPYISQFMALCDKLDIDPLEVLAKDAPMTPPPLARVNEKAVRKRTENNRRKSSGRS